MNLVLPPNPLTPYVALIKVGLVLVLIGALAWAGYKVNGWREAAQVNAAGVQQGNATAQATGEIGDAASRAAGARQTLEIQVTDNRAAAGRAYEELRYANPLVRDLTDQPIPDELRDYARARRESRDRLAGPAAGGGGPDGTAPPGR